MLDCVNASAPVSTRRLGPYFNGALAIGLSGTTLLAANAQLKPRLRSCKADHEVQLLRMPTTSDACLRGDVASQQPARKRNRWRPLAAVPAALPLRQCEDVVNFRGNGPEDGRLLVSGPSSAVLLYTDYVNETSLTTGSRYARRIYVATVELTRDGQQRLAARLGTPRQLRPATSDIATLARIEKNWSPWLHRASGQLHVHQWLDYGGASVVYRVDLSSGALVERHVAPLASADGGGGGGGGGGRWPGLQRLLGVPPHSIVSGGTPAAPLNATHYLAFGHTMTWRCLEADVVAKGKAARARCAKRTRWRSYASFAYVFSASPPFGLVGVTRAFRMRPPARDGTSEEAAGLMAVAVPSVHTAARDAAKAAGGADAACVTWDCIQFPVSLTVDHSNERVLVSWGNRDHETLVSWFQLRWLLSRLQPLGLARNRARI